MKLFSFKSVFLFLPACFLLLLSCGNPQPADKAEQDSSLARHVPKRLKTDTVRWMGYWKGEGKREDLLHMVKQEFSFLNQHILVHMRFEHDIPEILNINDLYFRKTPRYLASLIRNKSCSWDIIPLIGDSYAIIGELLNDPDWGSKYLVDFRTVPGFIETQKNFIVNDPKYTRKTSGILIGPYIEGYYYALYFNKHVADMAGISIKQAGMTAEDLKGYLRQLHAYNKSTGNSIAGFYDASDWTMLTALFNYLCLSEKGFTRGYAIPPSFSSSHRAAVKKTLLFFESLAKYNPLIKNVRQNRWSTSKHLVLQDKALFYINGTWMFNNWETIDSSAVYKMIPAELPCFKNTEMYFGNYAPNFAVLKHSPNRDNAVSLLMHWTKKDVVEDWIRYSKSPSGTKSYTESMGSGGDIYEQYVHYISDKYGKNIIPAEDNMQYIFGRHSSISTTFIGTRIHAILQKTKTAQEVYAELLNAAGEAL